MPDPAPAPAPSARPPRAPRTFGVLELLVAMSIVVTLAGMLVPYSERVGERTALTTATTNLATIARSFAAATSASAAWMRGSGELPAGAPAELAPQTAPLDREQRAELLLALQPDPWGSAYLIFLDDPGRELDESRVVSAGPDRALGTADDLQQPIR